MSEQLFVYGTLLPTEHAWGLLAPFAAGWAADAVVGTLLDTGLGWPALRLEGDDVVPGAAVELVPEVAGPALARLDDYEGLGDDQYRRRPITTVGGRRCWVYEWVGPTRGFTPVVGGWARRSVATGPTGPPTGP